MNPSEMPRRCHACKQGELLPSTRQRTYAPLGKKVVVDLLTSRCNVCGAQATSSQQHKENLARLRARKVHYGPLLMGEEISRFRRRYGLTQRAAAQIFGKGLISFSRYENETSYPDLSTTKLLKQAILRPDVLKDLAEEEGVEIPLWEERCEEVRRQELLRSITQKDSRETHSPWRRAYLSAQSGPAAATAREGGAFEVVFAPQQIAMLSCNEGTMEEAMAA